MQIIIQDTAHNSIDNTFEYLSNYSIQNAIETTEEIYSKIYDLENYPYIWNYISKMTEIPDKKFREFIYKKRRNQAYRIIYYISEVTDTIHILYIANCKQNFHLILKQNNYFSNYLNF